MGLVYASVELINGEDILLARRNIIGNDEIKKMQVSALVDTEACFALTKTSRSNFKYRS